MLWKNAVSGTPVVDRSLASTVDFEVGATGVVYRGCCGSQKGATGVITEKTALKGVQLECTAVMSGFRTRGDRHEAGGDTVDEPDVQPLGIPMPS